MAQKTVVSGKKYMQYMAFVGRHPQVIRQEVCSWGYSDWEIYHG